MRFKAAHIVSTVLLGVVLAALIAGCGSSKSSSSSSESAPATSSSTASTPAASSESSGSSSGGGEQLSLEADKEGQLKFDKTSLSAKAGAVSIAFTNNSPVGHNLTLESSSGSTVGSTPTFTGGSKTVTATLKPGTYKFFCSVPGHRQAGMEGTITVK